VEEEEPPRRHHHHHHHRNPISRFFHRRHHRRPPPPEDEYEEEEQRLVPALKRRLERRSPTDASSSAIFPPEGLAPAWLKMNAIKESEALKMQIIIKENAEKLNKIYSECGFIPPDSEIGNADTCKKEMKTGQRKEFIVKLYGKNIVLKVDSNKSPDENYASFVGELKKNGLHMNLPEKCAEDVAKITGKPIQGVVSAKIANVVGPVAQPLSSMTSQMGNIGKEAVSDQKQLTATAQEKSPSGALTVKGATGKDGNGNSNKAAEKIVQTTGPAAVEKQNEVNNNAKN